MMLRTFIMTILHIKKAEYEYYGTWMIIGINLPAIVGKQKQINITLPNFLIDRRDNTVKTSNSFYRDKSFF
ncbi:type II toxin-antitoxin system HicB family antitoxin [Gilliamella apicola]|uniref:type II toxin-antitoxin system HicB family antitoxin n=1 Tax=Gilliamella sp. wkB308 TaxID=3120263 RepID=UPI0009BC9BA4